MKKMLLISLLSLLSTSAFSAANRHFYVCSGIAGVEEYRVGINLISNKAAFFDGDTLSHLKLTETRTLESYPVQVQLIFEGKDEGAAGMLKLFFNMNRKKASLHNITTRGGLRQIGSANCENATPWNELN